MEYKETNVCPNCGGRMTNKGGRYDCPYCGRSFREENIAEKLAEVRHEISGAVTDALFEQRLSDIANARRNLYAAIHEKYIESGEILRCSREVKKYLSDDVQASFYEIAVSENAKAINKFLDDIDIEKYDYLASDIIEFMLKSLEKSNVAPLKNFIVKAYSNDGEKRADYIARADDEAKKIAEGVYRQDLPRDVFVAYSSADIGAVNEITEYLESRGLRCFVTARNMRRGRDAVENYASNLKTALKNCRCAVFVSSDRSRDFDSDALKNVLPYIKENLPDMGRAEYVIEEYRETPQAVKEYLGDFFDGEPCRTKEALADRISRIDAKRENSGSSAKINYDDFEIEEDILLKYKGSGGEVTIPDGVTDIAECAFCKCGVTSVWIPSSVTKISNPFVKCGDLTQIKVSRRNPEYHSEGNCVIHTKSMTLMAGCKSSVIPANNGVTSIGGFAFNNCIGLTHAVIPGNIESVGEYAFYNCSDLTDIELRYGVTRIEKSAFGNCTSLSHVELPNSLEYIGDCVFSFCTELRTVEYNGTTAQWRAIEKADKWNLLSDFTVKCADGDVVEKGKSWQLARGFRKK